MPSAPTRLIDSRLEELREQVRLAETRADDYKKANKILTSEGGVVNEQQLTRMNAELVASRAVAAESKARRDQVQAAIKAGAEPDVLGDAGRSGLIGKAARTVHPGRTPRGLALDPAAARPPADGRRALAAECRENADHC